MKRLLPRSEFSRNVLTLMSGTVIAQAIPVVVSPILTRLFGPTDFGVLALFLSIGAILVVVATGRYELAILLPRREREAFDLVLVAIGLALIFCALAFLTILLFQAQILAGGATSLGSWLYLIPLSVLMTAWYQSLSYWSNRKKSYKQLVNSRIAQTGTTSGAQVALGAANAAASGLILGYLAGQFVANAALLRTALKDAARYLNRRSFQRALVQARRYRKFPAYMVPGHLSNVVSGQMPVLLLTVLFGPAVAGFYALAERVLVVPSTIIGSAIGDVYREQAARAYSTSGSCRELYVRTVKKLAMIGAPPCLLLMVIGPGLFSVVFGDNWRQSGEISALLAGMVFFQIVSSPLSQTVLLAGMQKLDMTWQILRLILSAASIYLGYVLAASYELSVILFAISFSLLHLMHSFMQYKAACGKGYVAPGGAYELKN